MARGAVVPFDLPGPRIERVDVGAVVVRNPGGEVGGALVHEHAGSHRPRGHQRTIDGNRALEPVRPGTARASGPWRLHRRTPSRRPSRRRHAPPRSSAACEWRRPCRLSSGPLPSSHRGHAPRHPRRRQTPVLRPPRERSGTAGPGPSRSADRIAIAIAISPQRSPMWQRCRRYPPGRWANHRAAPADRQRSLPRRRPVRSAPTD